MLTPEQIQAMNEMTGLKKATTTAVGVGKSRADEIRKLAGVTAAPQPEQGLFSRVKSDVVSGVQEGKKILASNENPLRKGFELAATASGVPVKAATEVLPGVARTGLEKIGEGASAVINKLGDMLGSTQLAQDFVTNHPDAAKFLEDAAAIAGAGAATAGNVAAIQGGINTAKKIPATVEKTVEATKQGLGNMAKESAVKTQDRAVEAAGKVVQGKVKNAPVAAKTLSEIDTTGVKTYEDLSGKLGSHIKENLSKVDQEFAKDTTPRALNDLSIESKGMVAGKEVTASANYVKDALTQLKELYKSTNDPLSEAKITVLENKALTEGLTPTEINDLARQYGTEFGQKAFSKTGDPLTSVNAQAFENTRTGIKDTARSFLTDDAAKALDKATSDAIATKQLVDRMKENVNKLSQRVEQRGLIEKIGRALGKTVDMATFGGPKAFIQKLFFPSNVGLKTLNSLDLEAQLQKNLKLIKKLSTLPDKSIPGEILKYVNESMKLKDSIRHMLLNAQEEIGMELKLSQSNNQ